MISIDNVGAVVEPAVKDTAASAASEALAPVSSSAAEPMLPMRETVTELAFGSGMDAVGKILNVALKDTAAGIAPASIEKATASPGKGKGRGRNKAQGALVSPAEQSLSGLTLKRSIEMKQVEMEKQEEGKRQESKQLESSRREKEQAAVKTADTGSVAQLQSKISAATASGLKFRDPDGQKSALSGLLKESQQLLSRLLSCLGDVETDSSVSSAIGQLRKTQASILNGMNAATTQAKVETAKPGNKQA